MLRPTPIVAAPKGESSSTIVFRLVYFDADVGTEIMIIAVLVAFLKIGGKTAYTMVQSGELPGFKVLDQWRFLRADIHAWLDRQVRPAPPGGERDE